jgi:hypothetical protein
MKAPHGTLSQNLFDYYTMPHHYVEISKNAKADRKRRDMPSKAIRMDWSATGIGKIENLI